MTNLNVATTIRNQLGANRFDAMTGAKGWAGDKDSVQFSIGKNPAKVNKVKITLNANDEYTMEFFHFTMPKMNMKTGDIVGGLRNIAKIEGVQVSNLREVFTRTTGLQTSL